MYYDYWCYCKKGVYFKPFLYPPREYSCEHEAMLNLTLLNTGCPRVSVHETAVQMLHLLYKRFFLDDVVHTGDEGEEEPGASQDATLLWHSNQGLSKKQLQVIQNKILNI